MAVGKVGKTETVLALVAALFFVIEAGADGTQEYKGMCDASAVAILDDGRIAVANDEDNVVQIYDLSQPDPVGSLDLNPFLDSIRGADDSEADIEGVAEVGGDLFWIGSHGRSKRGKLRPQRAVLFATNRSGDSLESRGVVHRTLREELSDAPGLKKLGLVSSIRIDLSSVKELAPKIEGLSIEGLVVAPDGKRLWIGLRNPMLDGKAIVIELANPQEITHGKGKSEFSAYHLIDLGGDGVRGLAFDAKRSRYLVLSGPKDDSGRVALWAWSAAGSAPVKLMEFADLTAEGIDVSPDGDWAVVVSDDGDEPINGQKCKNLADPKNQKFRARRIDLP